MRVRSFPMFLALAVALAFATLLIASFSAGAFVRWLQSLPPEASELVQPVLALATALFVALGVVLRRRRGASRDQL